MPLPVAVPLIAGGVQAALGFFGARAKAKEAARREKWNAEMGALDTRFAPFVSGRSRKVEEIEAPSVLGATLGGALRGAQMGMNVYKGLQQSDLNDELLKKLRGEMSVGPGLQAFGKTINPMSIDSSNIYSKLGESIPS